MELLEKIGFLKKYLKTIKSFELLSETFWGGKTSFSFYPLSNEYILQQRKSFVKANPNEKINLYIHIPFCFKFCSYCRYYKESYDKEKILKYEQYLEDYIDFISPAFDWSKISSLYIWWWTPSILSDELLEKLLNKIMGKFVFSQDASLEFEWNPTSLTISKIKILSKYWINRVSIWVQTLNEEVLTKNNRWYQTLSSIKNTIKNLRDHNIEDINLDLLIWLSEDEKKDFLYSLNILSSLDINTIMAYRLIPTEHYIKTFFQDDKKLFYEYFNTQLEDLHKNLSETISKYNFLNFDIDKQSSHCRIFNLKDYKNSRNGYTDMSNSLLWIWPSSRSHIKGNLTYTQISAIYENFDLSKITLIWKEISMFDEILKKIFILIRDKWCIDVSMIFQEFWIDIFSLYKEEIGYFKKKKLLKISQNKIYFDTDLVNKYFTAISFLPDDDLQKRIFSSFKIWEHIVFEFDESRIYVNYINTINIYIQSDINKENIDKYYIFVKYIKMIYNIYLKREKLEKFDLYDFYKFLLKKNYFWSGLKIFFVE